MHVKKINDIYKQASQVVNPYTFFSDCVKMHAIVISNMADKLHSNEREAEFLKLEAKYKSYKLTDNTTLYDKVVALYTETVLAMEDAIETKGHLVDILGPIFSEYKGKNNHGQFFTPPHIANLMARLIDDSPEDTPGDYQAILEPTCGSGVMVLGYANNLIDKKVNYQSGMLALAVDIDITCVYMTYIQLSLYGIPAIVVHGNMLTNEYHSFWYTPMYFLNGFLFKDNSTEIPELSAERAALRAMQQPELMFVKNMLSELIKSSEAQ